MKFKKSFGQVFLRDKRFVSKIIQSLDVAGEVVVEIGPGSGVLTRKLCAHTEHLYCIEKDISLSNLLQGRFSSEAITVINRDILRFDIQGLGRDVCVVGNVPYNISNQLIRYLITHRRSIKRAYITFQKEFAGRLVAQKDTAHYGFLSCYFQYYACVSVLFDIPRAAFHPQPQVDSSFVEISFLKKPACEVSDEGFLFGLIRSSFRQRRKKLSNALEALYGPKALLQKAFQKATLDPELRAQNLSLQDYCRLANILTP